MTSLKVLHINNYDNKGGAETVFRITSCTPKAQNFTGYIKLVDSDQKPEISFHNWEDNNKLLGTINYIFSIRNYKLIKIFLDKNEIDVIHLHGFFSSLSPSILLAIQKAKKKRKFKVIQTLHDFHLICPNASLYNFSQNKICEKCIGKKAKLSIFINNCDRRGFVHSAIKGIRSIVANNIFEHKKNIDTFICPSEFLKSKLIEDGIEEKKIVVIHNPVTINGNQNTIEKQNIICFFGRFSKEKNLDFLINAFTTWKLRTKNDFQLLLIGEGEEETKIRMLAAKSDFSKNIIFKKHLPLEQLVNEIKLAKYFSMATVCYENAPMSVIESVALDIIPLTPDIGGMKESVEHVVKAGKTYSLNDIESWIKTIEYLESNYQDEVNRLINAKKDLIKELGTITYYTKIWNIYSV